VAFQGEKQIAGVGLGAVVPFRGLGKVFGGDDVAEQLQGSHPHDGFAYTEIKLASILWLKGSRQAQQRDDGHLTGGGDRIPFRSQAADGARRF
jgi:hypothetical protein